MPLTNTHEVIGQVVKSLFHWEFARLAKIQKSLLDRNKDLYPNQPHHGFTYRAEVYDIEGLPPRMRRTRVPLHPSLAPEMEEFIEDQEKVWTDRHAISQMLYLLLNPCDSKQDVRDALPNCVVDTIEDYRRMPRTKPEAYTLQSNPMHLRQYQKALRRMEFYATARLLY